MLNEEEERGGDHARSPPNILSQSEQLLKLLNS